VEFEPLDVLDVTGALHRFHFMPGLHIADFMVRGRITWDENEDGRLPMLVIDGKEISWDQFGRMVAGFEGWQFRFEIRDRSEKI